MIAYGTQRVEGPITNNYGMQWLLVWALDHNGSIWSVTRPATVSKNSYGCNAYTKSQLDAYKGGAWNEVMLTSYNNPQVRFIFNRVDNPTNLPLLMQALLNGGNSGMNTNPHSMTLDTTKSSIPSSGGNPFQFMHDNNGSEPHDIPTFGVSDAVWNTGMFWGNIDAYFNYGGFMNSTTATTGNVGVVTGDRLLVYVR